MHYVGKHLFFYMRFYDRCPHTWYPNARKQQRNVFLHVGPTNSGKTYQALKQLECSSTGKEYENAD